MDLHIDNCVAKYKVLFPLEDNPSKTGETDIDKEIHRKERYDEFERFFFIEMNSALFSGEYLADGYIQRIEKFENDLLTDDSKDSACIREVLKELREILFNIQNKIKIDNRDLQVALTRNDQIRSSQFNEYQYYNAWRAISLSLLHLDHTLVNKREYRELLIRLYYEIQVTINGLGNEDLREVYRKLESKCLFLLGKTFVYDDVEDYYYSVDFEVKKAKEIIKGDEFNKDFLDLFTKMYPCKYGRDIVNKYQQSFAEKKFSSIGFVLLSYYYGTSEKSSVQRLDNLLYNFKEYEQNLKEEGVSQFNSYAIRSIKSYISNCRFSLLLKQGNFTVEKIKNNIDEIESIQEETGIKNYHPYKKVLSFLGNYLGNLKDEGNKELQNGLDLYNKIFKKYKSVYEECILRHFTPFQLIVEDCKTQGGIFIASSLSKPISPSKLREDERELRDIKQYLIVKARLSKREEEINEIANKIKDFRRESFEYLGIFITIITFLFGSIQLFGNNTIKLAASIVNIVSLGIVLGLFIAMLYIVLYCKRYRVLFLFGFIIFSLVVLILFNINIK